MDICFTICINDYCMFGSIKFPIGFIYITT